MSRYDAHAGKPAGTSPGTVVYIGEERNNPVTISFISYDQHGARTAKVISSDEVTLPNDGQGISWYTIDGIHDPKILNAIGERFGLHGLVLEDIANTNQRPKIEEFD